MRQLTPFALVAFILMRLVSCIGESGKPHEVPIPDESASILADVEIESVPEVEVAPEVDVVPEPKPSPEHVHAYTGNVVEATCTNGGYTLYKCACGEEYKDAQTKALGHKHTATVTAPTCDKGGYTTYTCVCGDTYQSDETAAKGHSYTKQTVAPAGAARGYHLYVCSACGTNYTEEFEIPKTWSAWSEWSTVAVTAADTRQVETRQVEVAPARIEFRYGNYTNAGHDVWCVDYGKTVYSGTWSETYTPWSTTRKGYTGHNAYCANSTVSHPHLAGFDTNGWAYWYIYSDDGTFTGWNKTYWYWEETRTIPAEYRTEYRYRELVNAE